MRKHYNPTLCLLALLFAGCVSNTGLERWNSLSLDESVKLQNQTTYDAEMTVVELIQVDNASFAETLKAVNQARKSSSVPNVTVEFDEQPIKDFARNPDAEINQMENLKITLVDRYVTLYNLIFEILRKTKKGDISLYGHFYADGKVEILPNKYFAILKLYYGKITFRSPQTLAAFMEPFTLAYQSNGPQPNLYLNSYSTYVLP